MREEIQGNPLFRVGKLRVEGTRLLDREGRQVLLHGVNMVCKEKARGYIGDWTEADFAWLRNHGMNVVRLGVQWAGVEPEPGRFDEAYLDKLETLVRQAGNAGLHVFLDMHQDLYGETFADGAPAWATLCDDVPHDASGAVWSDAYLNSQAVQTAFDRFWANAPGPDGMGLRDHYARTWRRLAERFGGFDCVVGYDLMNEPFPGSAAVEIEGAMIQSFLSLQEAMATGSGADVPVIGTDAGAAGASGVADAAGIAVENASGGLQGLDVPEGVDMASLWMDPEGRGAILSLLTDPEVYEAISQGMEPALHPFDRDILSPFYQQVADAIREVDADTLLFLEASYFSNMGVRSGIVPVQRNGARDPQQVYAPHGYDLIVDTQANDLWSPARVEVIFKHHAQIAEKHGWPALVGEWGAFWENAEGGGCGSLEQADQLRTIFEDNLFGDTFWAYANEGVAKQNLAGFRYSGAIVRGVPRAVNGQLLSYRWSPESGELKVRWVEGTEVADTEVWVPGEGVSVQEQTREGEWDVAICRQHAQTGGTFISLPAGEPGMTRTVCVRNR